MVTKVDRSEQKQVEETKRFQAHPMPPSSRNDRLLSETEVQRYHAIKEQRDSFVVGGEEVVITYDDIADFFGTPSLVGTGATHVLNKDVSYNDKDWLFPLHGSIKNFGDLVKFVLPFVRKLFEEQHKEVRCSDADLEKAILEKKSFRYTGAEILEYGAIKFGNTELKFSRAERPHISSLDPFRVYQDMHGKLHVSLLEGNVFNNNLTSCEGELSSGICSIPKPHEIQKLSLRLIKMIMMPAARAVRDWEVLVSVCEKQIKSLIFLADEDPFVDQFTSFILEHFSEQERVPFFLNMMQLFNQFTDKATKERSQRLLTKLFLSLEDRMPADKRAFIAQVGKLPEEMRPECLLLASYSPFVRFLGPSFLPQCQSETGLKLLGGVLSERDSGPRLLLDSDLTNVAWQLVMLLKDTTIPPEILKTLFVELEGPDDPSYQMQKILLGKFRALSIQDSRFASLHKQFLTFVQESGSEAWDRKVLSSYKLPVMHDESMQVAEYNETLLKMTFPPTLSQVDELLVAAEGLVDLRPDRCASVTEKLCMVAGLAHLRESQRTWLDEIANKVMDKLKRKGCSLKFFVQFAKKRADFVDLAKGVCERLAHNEEEALVFLTCLRDQGSLPSSIDLFEKEYNRAACKNLLLVVGVVEGLFLPTEDNMKKLLRLMKTNQELEYLSTNPEKTLALVRGLESKLKRNLLDQMAKIPALRDLANKEILELELSSEKLNPATLYEHLEKEEADADLSTFRKLVVAFSKCPRLTPVNREILWRALNKLGVDIKEVAKGNLKTDNELALTVIRLVHLYGRKSEGAEYLSDYLLKLHEQGPSPEIEEVATQVASTGDIKLLRAFKGSTNDRFYEGYIKALSRLDDPDLLRAFLDTFSDRVPLNGTTPVFVRAKVLLEAIRDNVLLPKACIKDLLELYPQDTELRPILLEVLAEVDLKDLDEPTVEKMLDFFGTLSVNELLTYYPQLKEIEKTYLKMRKKVQQLLSKLLESNQLDDPQSWEVVELLARRDASVVQVECMDRVLSTPSPDGLDRMVIRNWLLTNKITGNKVFSFCLEDCDATCLLALLPLMDENEVDLCQRALELAYTFIGTTPKLLAPATALLVKMKISLFKPSSLLVPMVLAFQQDKARVSNEAKNAMNCSLVALVNRNKSLRVEPQLLSLAEQLVYEDQAAEFTVFAQHLLATKSLSGIRAALHLLSIMEVKLKDAQASNLFAQIREFKDDEIAAMKGLPFFASRKWKKSEEKLWLEVLQRIGSVNQASARGLATVLLSYQSIRGEVVASSVRLLESARIEDEAPLLDKLSTCEITDGQTCALTELALKQGNRSYHLCSLLLVQKVGPSGVSAILSSVATLSNRDIQKLKQPLCAFIDRVHLDESTKPLSRLCRVFYELQDEREMFECVYRAAPYKTFSMYRDMLVFVSQEAPHKLTRYLHDYDLRASSEEPPHVLACYQLLFDAFANHSLSIFNRQRPFFYALFLSVIAEFSSYSKSIKTDCIDVSKLDEFARAISFVAIEAIEYGYRPLSQLLDILIEYIPWILPTRRDIETTQVFLALSNRLEQESSEMPDWSQLEQLFKIACHCFHFDYSDKKKLEVLEQLFLAIAKREVTEDMLLVLEQFLSNFFLPVELVYREVSMEGKSEEEMKKELQVALKAAKSSLATRKSVVLEKEDPRLVTMMGISRCLCEMAGSLRKPSVTLQVVQFAREFKKLHPCVNMQVVCKPLSKVESIDHMIKVASDTDEITVLYHVLTTLSILIPYGQFEYPKLLSICESVWTMSEGLDIEKGWILYVTPMLIALIESSVGREDQFYWIELYVNRILQLLDETDVVNNPPLNTLFDLIYAFVETHPNSIHRVPICIQVVSYFSEYPAMYGKIVDHFLSKHSLNPYTGEALEAIRKLLQPLINPKNIPDDSTSPFDTKFFVDNVATKNIELLRAFYPEAHQREMQLMQVYIGKRFAKIHGAKK